MRNATCVGTQTSKVPTRVALLFINYSVVMLEALPVIEAVFRSAIHMYQLQITPRYANLLSTKSQAEL